MFQLSGCPCTTLQSSLIIPTRSMQMKLIICFSGSLTSFLFESMLLFWMLRCVNVTVGLLNSRKWTALKWNKGGDRGMKMTKNQTSRSNKPSPVQHITIYLKFCTSKLVLSHWALRLVELNCLRKRLVTSVQACFKEKKQNKTLMSRLSKAKCYSL